MKRLLFLTALATPILADAAQVFTTDVIVQGSECIGVDCSSSETFSFDTLRLKENNLRMHFDDTSASASFPANDWRFTFNDSGNGGASFFSVDDATSGKVPFKIEAGAPNNTLFVATEGRIGVKTSTPAVDIHNVNGNTPTLRLEQDGSSGFASQTWDLAGNETNFFIRDVTNNSLLPFRIKPGSPKSSIFIQPSGVGINTGDTSPAAQLDVKGDLLVEGKNSTGETQVHIKTDTSDNTNPILVIESTQSSVVDQSMMRLINSNGDSRIEMENKSTGIIWRITDDGSSFSITKVGSGAKELELTSEGNLILTGDVTFAYDYTSGEQNYTGTTSLSDLLRRIHNLENN